MRYFPRRNLAGNSIAVTAITVGMAALFMPPAIADGNGEDPKNYPRIEGSLVVEIENDNTFRSDDPGAEINNLFAKIELATGLYVTGAFSLRSLIVLEPVRDPPPFANRAFDDHGAYFEELYVQWENERVRIFAGKFDAPFGTAWDVTPGIYGTDFAEDYELAERIGGGIGASFSTMVANSNTFTVAGFFADTSVLSASAITNRGRARVADGGAGNTESIESFSITLDSEEFAVAPGLATHIGFDHQAAGLGDAGDETAFVIGAILEREFADGIVLATNVELAHLENAGGGPADITYVTLGTQFGFGGGWNIAAAGTLRRVEQAGGLPTLDDINAQLSGGYEFQEGFLTGTTIDVGIAFKDEGGVQSRIFGFLITREFDFELAPRQ